MAKTREQKEENIKELTQDLTIMKSAVFANFKGVSVNDTEELRNECRKNDIHYSVTKKTLLKLALEKTDIKGVDVKSLAGNLAAAFGLKDEMAPAKTLYNFSQKHEGFKLLGGIMEKKFLSAAEVESLAKLPSRKELLAKLVGSIKAPVTGLVNVLAGNLRGLVIVLNAIKDAKTGTQ